MRLCVNIILFVILIIVLCAREGFSMGNLLGPSEGISKRTEIENAYKDGDNSEAKITVGMTKIEVLNSWGNPLGTEKPPRLDDFGRDYVKIYGADELWTYPIAKHYFPKGRYKFYILLFKKDILIRILEADIVDK